MCFVLFGWRLAVLRSALFRSTVRSWSRVIICRVQSFLPVRPRLCGFAGSFPFGYWSVRLLLACSKREGFRSVTELSIDRSAGRVFAKARERPALAGSCRGSLLPSRERPPPGGRVGRVVFARQEKPMFVIVAAAVFLVFLI